MEAASRQRRVESAAGGSISRHRLYSNNSDDNDNIDGNRPAPVRPSTHRATKSTPRAAAEAARRLSVDPVDERAMGKVRLEVEALRDKLSEADLAKAQAQVQLQRQGADMAKLERYIGQLTDERGGVDTCVLESIVKDIEKSSRMKHAMEQVADLKADLSLKEKQVAALRKSQAVEYTLKLAEEKEALQVRVERLIAESNSKHDSGIRGRTTSFNSASSSQKEQSAASNEASLAELERLRAQNLKMRKESARLRAELELVEMRGDSGSGREHGSRSQNRDNMDRGRARQHCHSDGARFYEGQAVECRKQGSDSWLPATVDSVRLTIEPLGGGGDGGGGGGGGGGDSRGSHRTYMYGVYFDGEETGRREDVPEFRIRAAASGDGNGPGLGSSRVVRDCDGETVIRSRVFGAGDLVLVRDGGGGRTNQDNKKWTLGEVIRRNDNGTYRVLVSGGQAEGKDFHPTMLRAQDGPKNSFDSGCDVHDQPGASQTKTKATSPAEEAEIRYAERREELLELARGDLPAPLHVGQEVIAKSGGSTVWSSGVVVATDSDNLRCRVEFDSGDVEDNLPCIFVRPRRGGDLAPGGDARTGDAVLAQKTRKQDTRSGDRGDWFAARFRSYDEDDADSCYVTFDGERASSRLQATRVRFLYPSARGGGGRRNDRPGDDDAMIPGNPPPPTKPVRAKKHREGDIVLACIPTVKKWTPAVITGVKGHGRYSVEWADFVREKPLLFMHIASMQGPSRKRAISVGHKKSSDDSADSHHATTRAPASGASGGGDTGSDERRSRVLSAESSAGGITPSVRLRQRALNVGEPVLAKKAPDQGFWSPGSVTRADGGGRYDIRFTDGTTAEDLSFLFVRGLSAEQSSGDDRGGEVDTRSGRITSDTSEMHPSGERDPVVGDSVYVLKRGHSVEITSQDMHNRDLWRVATVTAVASGRYTVQYNGEEGKPKESRVVAERLRVRNVIRQKAVQMGDAVLALSKTPGRGWVMGAVTARGSDGKYTISFTDGTESDQIRFVNLRRVVGHAEGEEKDDHNDKPSPRAIRQRRFKKGELALTKHSETRKWVIVKVLEALPSGRYDLQFLEEGSPNALGVPFQHIRHLDLACFAGDSQGATGNGGGGGGGGKRSPRDDMAVGERIPTESHTMSDEGWDGNNGHDYHAHSGHRSRGGSEEGYHQEKRVEKPRQQREASAGGGSTDYDERDETPRNRREGDGNRGASSETRPLTIGSDVYVLRRGKRQDADLQDKTSWRSGKVVFVRSNGTFAVEYDEDGSPKEDRIAENRLRRRLNNNDKDGGDGNGSNNNRNGSNSSNNDFGRYQDRVGSDEEYGDDFHRQDNKFEAGDMAFAQTRGWGRKNWTRVTVDAYLGKGLYRVEFADGSGTKELDSKKLSHTDPSGTTHKSKSSARAKTDPQSTKSRWLDAGDPVVARRAASSNDDGASGRKWEAAKVVKVIDEEYYSVLFSGDPEPVRVHFTEVKPLEDHAADNSRLVTTGLFLRVTEPSFDLKIAASAARHTSPRLILATGERANEHDALWLHHKNIDNDENDDDAWSNGSKRVQRNRNHNDGTKAVGFLSRGAARPGSRNPSWRDGEFWLSLKGLDDPALFVALEDGKKVQEQRGGGRGGWKRGEGGQGGVAFLAEACIPVPLEDLRGGGGGGGRGRQRRNGTVEVELLDGAGVVTLQWSLHEDTSKMQ